MAKLIYIKAIQAFEAVARHQSYIGAAHELNVTPAAVGQQIRALESHLGISLFERRDGGSRRLQLNSFAAEALADFQRGFDHIELGLEKLKSRNTQNLITVTVSQVFMAKWLLPRLDDFTQKYPHIEVRLDITDAVVDIARKEADMTLAHPPAISARRWWIHSPSGRPSWCRLNQARRCARSIRDQPRKTSCRWTPARLTMNRLMSRSVTSS